jgi:hypothetical protein
MENFLNATHRVRQGAYSFLDDVVGMDRIGRFGDLLWKRHGDDCINFSFPGLEAGIHLTAFWHCIRRMKRTSLYECFLEIASCTECKLVAEFKAKVEIQDR